jgi:hypothetical protein
MSPAGFEPTIPASARPQTYTLDRAATGIGLRKTAGTFCLLLSLLFLLFLFNIREYFQYSPNANNIFFSVSAWMTFRS